MWSWSGTVPREGHAGNNSPCYHSHRSGIGRHSRFSGGIFYLEEQPSEVTWQISLEDQNQWGGVQGRYTVWQVRQGLLININLGNRLVIVSISMYMTDSWFIDYNVEDWLVVLSISAQWYIGIISAFRAGSAGFDFGLDISAIQILV